MILTIAFPTFLAVIAAVFLLRAFAASRRRNAQTWAQIVARLETGLDAEQLGACLEQNLTPEERWERCHGARGLCAMYQNAKIMLDMANYAVRHGSAIDAKMLAELRSDALQIRVSVITALVQYALYQLNDRICANAHHAASMYSEMTARMSELLKVGGGQLAPALVGAR